MSQTDERSLFSCYLFPLSEKKYSLNNIVSIIIYMWNVSMCSRDRYQPPHLAATQLLKETIPLNNKHVTYSVSTSHTNSQQARGERERERADKYLR